MTRAQRLRWKTFLLLGLTMLAASLAGCDGTAGGGTQPLAQLATDQLQHLPAFLVDFGRQMLAAWLL